MTQELYQEVNGYLVDIFNQVLMIEEYSLKNSQFSDLSVKEVHTIEAIGLNDVKTSGQVAQKLGVTPGTLSVAIGTIVKKGYVERVRTADDRRVVKLKLTPKGKLIYRLHHKFHMNMVSETLQGIDEEEAKVLVQGLRNLHQFLDGIKKDIRDV